MEPQQKNPLRRTACDHCRHQRLRCVRTEGQSECQRCCKLGKTCATAETRRPGRPRKPKTAPHDIATPTSTLPYATQAEDPATFTSTDATTLQLDQSMDFIPGTVGEADNYCGTNMVPCDDLGLLSMINAVQLPSPQCSMIPPFLSSPFFGPGLLPGVEQHAKLDGHECLKELSELNIDLHAQAAAIKAKTGTATLAAYICPEPLINIKPSSVVEMSLAAINKFYVTITNVEKLSRQNLHFDRAYDSSQQRDDNLFGGNLGSLNSIPLLEDDMEIAGNTTGTEDVPRKTQIRVDTPLALLMVSCYIQLINVFSDMFFVAQKTLRELKNEPIPSIGEHIMQMGMFYGMEGRLQGLIFCTIVTHYLDRVERILGLLPSSTKQSLPLKHGLLKEPHFKELLDKEMERYGVSGRSSPRVLRDTIENMRRVMAADASW